MNTRERIKIICKEKGISINQLEKDCGFGKGYISKLSESSASVAKIAEIAGHLNVSIDYLVGSQYSPFSDGEMRLVSLFRKLTDAEKENIINNMRFLIADAEQKKESASV